MNDKQLILQLKSLKAEIKPDAAWQARSRDVLLAQISQGAEAEQSHSWFSFIESASIRAFISELSRPVSIMAVVLFAILGGGVASLRAANQTKPGDALYIAKTISEKTQLAVTFDNTKKAKLNLEFASRRAEEIGQVTEQTENDKKAAVNQLENSFKEELGEAKVRIARMTPAKPVAKPAAKIAPKAEVVDNIEDNKDSQETAAVMGAALEKGTVAIEYYDPRAKLIEEAEQLFADKNYVASVEKLKTLSETFDKVEPAVEEKVATTTEEVKAVGTSSEVQTGTSTK